MHVVGLVKGTGEKQEASCSEPALMQANMASYLVVGTSEYCHFIFFKYDFTGRWLWLSSARRA